MAQARGGTGSPQRYLRSVRDPTSRIAHSPALDVPVQASQRPSGENVRERVLPVTKGTEEPSMSCRNVCASQSSVVPSWNPVAIVLPSGDQEHAETCGGVTL